MTNNRLINNSLIHLLSDFNNIIDIERKHISVGVQKLFRIQISIIDQKRFFLNLTVEKIFHFWFVWRKKRLQIQTIFIVITFYDAAYIRR